MPKAGSSLQHTVKVNSQVHVRLKQLINDISSKGWEHLGIARKDVPTYSLIIEEALSRLSTKRKGV
jgi:hypothetical protein